MTEKPFTRWIGLAVGIGIACGLLILFFLLLRPEKAYLPPSTSADSGGSPQMGTAVKEESGSSSLLETGGTAALSSGLENTAPQTEKTARPTSVGRSDSSHTSKSPASRKTSTTGRKTTTSRKTTTHKTTAGRSTSSTRDWREDYEEEYAALLEHYEAAREDLQDKLVSLAVDEEIELTILAERYQSMGLLNSGAYLAEKAAVQRKYAGLRQDVNEELGQLEKDFLKGKQDLQEKYPFANET